MLTPWLPAVLVCALGLGVPAALVAAGIGSAAWIAGGAAAWAAAVAFKALAGGPLWALLRRLGGRMWLPPLWGLWSALCELGAAARAFAWAREASLGDAIALGVGAGSAEALTILAVALAQRSVRGGGGGEPPVGLPAVVERFLASAGHVASRGLIWLSLGALGDAPARALALAAVALATFAAVDGYATHGAESGWDWEEPRTLLAVLRCPGRPHELRDGNLRRLLGLVRTAGKLGASTDVLGPALARPAARRHRPAG